MQTFPQIHHPKRFFRIHRVRCDFCDQSDVLQSRQARDKIVELEDEPDMLTTKPRESRVSGAGQLVVEVMNLAGGRYVQASQNIE